MFQSHSTLFHLLFTLLCRRQYTQVYLSVPVTLDTVSSAIYTSIQMTVHPGVLECSSHTRHCFIGNHTTLPLRCRRCNVVQHELATSEQRRVGPGHPPLFPLSIYFVIFCFFTFPFLSLLYLFSSFVHPFPFYQNSPTPFPGRRS